MYHANNNRFSGTLPRTLCQYAPLLRDLDISNNQVSGNVPDRIGLLASIESLNLASNQFTGPITENLFYFPGLRRLDLSNNRFVGTLPTYALQFTYALLAADFSNNSGVTGIIPPQMGFSEHVRTVTLTGTSLSCSGITRPFAVTVNASCNDALKCRTMQWVPANTTANQSCPADAVLPCFLRFSEESLPKDDSSNMRCKLIARRPPDDARASCASGEPPFSLGAEGGNLPEVSRTASEQAWVIDPGYYQYRGCSCLLGYAEVWSNNGTILTCVEQPTMDKRTTVIIAAVSAVAGFVILSALLAVGVLYLRTQPRWLRERVMQAKRLQGAPRAGKPGDRVAVSIVVTDVKGFSALTRQYPDAMIKAMGGHNNIMRKACHMHAGYVLDQEGDSWAVAFHDADDAVAFSLQVQQALARKVWILRVPASGQNGKLSPAPDLLQSLEELRREQLLKPTASMASQRHPSIASSAGGRAPGTDVSFSAAADEAAAAVAARTDSCSARRASLPPLASGPAAAAAAAAGVSAADDITLVLPADTPQSQQSARSSDPLAPIPSGKVMPVNAFAHDALGTSFTSSRGRGTACSSHSGSEFAMMATHSEPGAGAEGRGALAWLFGRPSSRSSNGSGVHAAQLSGTSDTHPQLDTAAGAAAAPASAADHQQQLQQHTDIEAARSEAPDPRRMVAPSRPSVASFASMSLSLLEGSRPGSSARRSTTDTAGSNSRLQSVSAALLNRFANRGNKSGSLVSPMGSNAAGLQTQQQLKALRISVRIGIASGTLHYGSDLQNCTVTHRAKELVSDVANGGQVLIDEPTFLLVKDSLSLLGTVSEAGYDDRLLQRLNQARVVGRLQQQVACVSCLDRREASFSSPLPEDEPQDYEHDAIVVHMGRFAAETPLAPGQLPSNTVEEDAAAADAATAKGRHKSPKRREAKDAAAAKDSNAAANAPDGAAAAAAGAAGIPASKADGAAGVAAALAQRSEAELELLFSVKKGASKASLQVQQLHLYSIASPGMRRWPEHTQDLGAALAWAEPVNMKRGWAQLQKGFFQAPGARRMDLTPSQSGHSRAPLPDVTLVFASVADSLSFTAKQSRATVRGVHAAIVRVLLAQMEAVAGGDGYLCRCQEGDLKYMVAFEQPHHAVQWCLLVQEALLYEAWEPAVLRHPGFEPVTCPDSGRPLFAGPRLRMGLAEGPPHSVLPDHSGRANYSGPSVIRAARFMDAAAHGGQVVTNLELVRRLTMGWVAQQREEPHLQQQQQQQQQQTNSRSAEDGQHHSQYHSQDGGAQFDQQQQQQLQPLALRGLISPIAEGQMLQEAAAVQGPRSSRSQGHLRLSWARRSSDDTVLDTGAGSSAAAEQALAPRSLSWSAARPTARLHRAAGPRGSADHAIEQVTLAAAAGDAADAAAEQLQTAGSAAAAAAAAAEATELDAVVALHLGQFRFKGSGEYEMVSLAHGALAGRAFPVEPPRGKGERLPGGVSPGVAVRDLPAVALRPPLELLAARLRHVHQQQGDDAKKR
uniref:Guanylate cyclase domain-containing protein n=1 Tax=Tetradesmus obliquus TaxID=3088 RepID=A0A383VNF8_TETOB|eukprot:jgi/Sobl393_1/15644/SZX66359.1